MSTQLIEEMHTLAGQCPHTNTDNMCGHCREFIYMTDRLEAEVRRLEAERDEARQAATELLAAVIGRDAISTLVEGVQQLEQELTALRIAATGGEP